MSLAWIGAISASRVPPSLAWGDSLQSCPRLARWGLSWERVLCSRVLKLGLW